MSKYSKVIWKRFYRYYKYPKMVRFYSQFMGEGDLCFDVGAHMGNRAEIFLGTGTKVVAVEPQSDCIDYMKRKFFGNPRITLINKGLSDREGELVFHICEDASTISTFSEKWKTGRFSNYNWNKSKKIPVTTLDALIEKNGLPVFCKIDVEGYEYNVLKGLSQPIPIISFEFTQEFFVDSKDCIDYLNTLGYARYNCSFGESAKMLFLNWVSPEELVTKINSIGDPLLWGDIYAKFS